MFIGRHRPGRSGAGPAHSVLPSNSDPQQERTTAFLGKVR